jgi:hypothetical protein
MSICGKPALPSVSLSSAEVMHREDFGEDWVHTRGSVIQRVFSHDVWHCRMVSRTATQPAG